MERRADMLVLVQREDFIAGKLNLEYDEGKTQNVYVTVKCTPGVDPADQERRFYLDAQIARASFVELLGSNKSFEDLPVIYQGRSKEEMIQYLKDSDH